MADLDPTQQTSSAKGKERADEPEELNDHNRPVLPLPRRAHPDPPLGNPRPNKRRRPAEDDNDEDRPEYINYYAHPPIHRFAEDSSFLNYEYSEHEEDEQTPRAQQRSHHLPDNLPEFKATAAYNQSSVSAPTPYLPPSRRLLPSPAAPLTPRISGDDLGLFTSPQHKRRAPAPPAQERRAHAPPAQERQAHAPPAQERHTAGPSGIHPVHGVPHHRENPGRVMGDPIPPAQMRPLSGGLKALVSARNRLQPIIYGNGKRVFPSSKSGS
jgi:hypothetical protein